MSADVSAVSDGPSEEVEETLFVVRGKVFFFGREEKKNVGTPHSLFFVFVFFEKQLTSALRGHARARASPLTSPLALTHSRSHSHTHAHIHTQLYK